MCTATTTLDQRRTWASGKTGLSLGLASALDSMAEPTILNRCQVACCLVLEFFGYFRACRITESGSVVFLGSGSWRLACWFGSEGFLEFVSQVWGVLYLMPDPALVCPSLCRSDLSCRLHVSVGSLQQASGFSLLSCIAAHDFPIRLQPATASTCPY